MSLVPPHLRFALSVAFLVGLGCAAGVDHLQADNPLIYTLTTNSNPIRRGPEQELDLTVTNTGATDEKVKLFYTIPPNCYGDGGHGSIYGPGTNVAVDFGTVAAGTSATLPVQFESEATNIPPEGLQLYLNFFDRVHYGGVSCPLTVLDEPGLDLKISADRAPVARGDAFVCTLNYHAINAAPGAVLSVPIPAGCDFVEVDGGAQPDDDGILRVPLGDLAPGLFDQRRVTLAVNASADNGRPMIVEASLDDATGSTAHTGLTLLVENNPAVSYTLTADSGLLPPGQPTTVTLTATNTSTRARAASLSYKIPLGIYGGDGNLNPLIEGGGQARVDFGNVPPGTTATRTLQLTTEDIDPIPKSLPDGLLLPLYFIDQTRGMAVSRTLTALSPPRLSSDTFLGTQGQPFAYQITATGLPYAFSADPLPDGLSVDENTGLISGVPTTPGEYSVTIAAANDVGVGEETLVISVRDFVPAASVAATTPAVSIESGGVGVFTLKLSAPPSASTPLHYTLKGNAVLNRDYTMYVGGRQITTKKALRTLTFEAGQTRKRIQIIPQGDFGGSPTKYLTLNIADGDAYVIGGGSARMRLQINN